VQGEPHVGDRSWRERHPAADSCAVAHLRRLRTPELDNNRRTNGDANTDAEAPQLFRRASQNLAAAAMLLHGCPKPATFKER
jgi:hypothetical protein